MRYDRNPRMFTYLLLFIVLLGLGLWAYAYMIRIRPSVERPVLAPNEIMLIDKLESSLQAHIHALAVEIGPRNIYLPEKLDAAADYIQSFWQEIGYEVSRQTYAVQQIASHNLIIEIRGQSRSEEILVIGAHYDSVAGGSPGANDNGSGVAALLEVSRLFRGKLPGRTVRFVAFTNEEPLFFKTEDMGSRVYARRVHEKGENIIGMISLETIGYFRQDPGSQHYPFPLSFFYPDTGDFLAVIGNLQSRQLVQSFAGHFMNGSDIPLECAALPSFIMGVDWSDHSSFWHYGYPAIMLTDTALFRYPWYHSTQDTADKVDYAALARVTHGIFRAVSGLAE